MKHPVYMCVCVSICVLSAGFMFSRVAAGLAMGLLPVPLPHRMSRISISEVGFGLKQSEGLNYRAAEESKRY